MNDQYLKAMSRADVLRRFRWTARSVQLCSHLALFRTARRIIGGRLASRATGRPPVPQVRVTDFRANLSAMIGLCTARDARVVLADTLVAVRKPAYPRAIAELANQHGLPLVRFRDAVYAYLKRDGRKELAPADLSEVMWEQFHPNGKGNQALAIAVAQAVKRQIDVGFTNKQGDVQ